MIKSLEILRPADFPYRLVSFKFFFENIDSHYINMYHAAGMNFIYVQKKVCYLFPQNEFYELLQLQNFSEPHDKKYNWLLLKGEFGGDAKIKAALHINPEQYQDLLPPVKALDGRTLSLYKIPEPGNALIIAGSEQEHLFNEFACDEIGLEDQPWADLRVSYLGILAGCFSGHQSMDGRYQRIASPALTLTVRPQNF